MTGLPPQDAEQRYWRRRANRRVRKARWTRNVLRGGFIVLVNVMIAALLVFAGNRGLQQLAQSDWLVVRATELTGTKRASAEALHQRIGSFKGQNLLEVDLVAVEHAVLQDPWVRACSVKRVLPNRLRVEVAERRPGALAVIHGRAHLVDDSGFVIGTTGPGRDDDLPLLRGFEGMTDRELTAALRTGVEVLGRLELAAPEFVEDISELDLNCAEGLRVRTVSLGPELLLDASRVERNVLRYLEMKDRIRGYVGNTDYVDLRWENRITVRPTESEQTPSEPAPDGETLPSRETGEQSDAQAHNPRSTA